MEDTLLTIKNYEAARSVICTKYHKYSIYAPTKKFFESVVKNHNHLLFFKDILPLGIDTSALFFLSECVMRSIDTKNVSFI